MTEPTENSAPAPTPQVPTPGPRPTPTPASLQGDVPVESWRARLAEAKDAPSAERHEHLAELLNELDSQVSSL